MVGTTIKRALLRIEGRDQPVDQRRIDLRHVAEADDRAVDIVRQRGDAGLERGGEAPRRNRDCATKRTSSPASAASTVSR